MIWVQRFDRKEISRIFLLNSSMISWFEITFCYFVVYVPQFSPLIKRDEIIFSFKNWIPLVYEFMQRQERDLVVNISERFKLHLHGLYWSFTG